MRFRGYFRYEDSQVFIYCEGNSVAEKDKEFCNFVNGVRENKYLGCRNNRNTVRYYKQSLFDGTSCGPHAWITAGKCVRKLNIWKRPQWNKCIDCGTKSFREVHCSSPTNLLLDDDECSGLKKPNTERECSKIYPRCEKKQYRWKIEPWSKCSPTCYRSRTVTCLHNNIPEIERLCDNQFSKPHTKESCFYDCKINSSMKYFI